MTMNRDRRPDAVLLSLGSAPFCLRAEICLLLILALADVAQALDHNKSIDQYGHESWTSQNGLPGDAVYQILQTLDGYLWMRTSVGLVRFDGVRFALRLRPWFRQSLGWLVLLLFTVQVRAFATQKEMSHYNLRVWQTQDGLPQNSVYQVLQTKDGYLWMSTSRGVAPFDGQTW